MGDVLLCHTNRADAATLSNGSWNANLPLNNLKDGNVDKVARATNAVATSTRFAVDLGALFSIRAIALVKHNMTTAATWRVKGGTAAPDASNVFATGQVFDSTALNAKQLTFNLDAPAKWGEQYMALYARDAATVRYITVDITDTANPSGYVQIGRLFVGSGLQPAYGVAYGISDRWDDLSVPMESESGKRYYNKRRKRRSVEFQLPFLSLAEGNYVHELDAAMGVTEEVLYVPDPADTALSQRYGFLATMRELTPLEYPLLNNRAKAYRLDEKL